MPDRPKCHWCHKPIPKERSYITLYYAPTQYIYFFCSISELIRWYLAEWIKRLRTTLGKKKGSTNMPDREQ